MMGLAITAGAIMARILKETINTGQLWLNLLLAP
jgi:hypothetical protein